MGVLVALSLVFGENPYSRCQKYVPNFFHDILKLTQDLNLMDAWWNSLQFAPKVLVLPMLFLSI
jgi:hypothetical protein